MQLIKGDIFQNKKGIIVHGCNVSGGFGSGVAGQIAKLYPEARKAYMEILGRASLDKPHTYLLGDIQVVRIQDDFWIVNAFTQEKYGGEPGVKYASAIAIAEAMEKTAVFAAGMKLDVHTPKIGCGLGGLDWIEVEPMMRNAHYVLQTVSQKLTVYYI